MDTDNNRPKVALVTGGSMGIGYEIALEFSERGFSVVIADLKNSEATAKKLSTSGACASGFDVDISDAKGVRVLAEHVENTYGSLDVLVNNAGIFSTLEFRPFEEIPEAEMRRVLNVNALGTMICTKAVMHLLKLSSAGRVINIASNTALRGIPGLAHYVASKGAVIAFTKALARELGQANITVNAVAPGFTFSDGVKNNPSQIATVAERARIERSIARDQQPSDIVGAVVFFAGDDAAFVTGQVLVVDGGALMH